MSRTLLLIVNPHAAAGQARGRWEALLVALDARGLRADHTVTEHPGHATALAREAAGRYDTLVAVGGDGTVHEVATGILLSAHQPTLGIIPLGTGNDVAQLMGIAGVEDGLRAITRGESRAIDAIEVRCRRAGEAVTRYALLYAAVGFVSTLLKHTTPLVKRLFGMRYSYSVGFFRALLLYRTPVMRITRGDQRFDGPTFFACAGNAEYAGGGVMRLSPGAKPDDGLLNITLISTLNRVQILQNFPRLLAGTHVELPSVRYFTGVDLTIEADMPLDVAIDGDLVGQTPAEFHLKARALRILCAPSAGIHEQEREEEDSPSVT